MFQRFHNIGNDDTPRTVSGALLKQRMAMNGTNAFRPYDKLDLDNGDSHGD